MKLSHSLALALAALSASCQTAHAAHDARAAKAKISKIPFFTPSYGKDVEQEMMGITTRSDTFVDALYTAPEDGAEPMDLDSGDEWDGDDQFAMKRARTGKDITPKSGFDFKFLLNNMDAKADPCQDFYQFSCGGFHAKNKLPEDAIRIDSSFHPLMEKNEEILWKVLEGSYPRSSGIEYIPKERGPDRANFYRMKDFYESCMDVRTLNAAGAAPLKPYLDMLRKTDFTSLKSRTKTIAELHRADNSGLFIPFVMEDREDPSKYAIYLAQGSTGLPPQLMMLPFFSEILVDKVAAFLNGFRILDVDARPLARKIVQLEFRLAKMAMRGPPVSFMDNNGLDRVSLEELQSMSNMVNWQEYFQLLGVQGQIKEVIVLNKAYLQQLPQILDSVDQQTLRYYMLYKLMDDHADALSPEIVQKANDEFDGRSMSAVRKGACFNAIDSKFAFMLAKYFIKELVKTDIKAPVSDLIVRLKSYLRSNIATSKWMDKKTKVAAIQKLDAIAFDKVGYPDWIMNTTLVAEEYDYDIVKGNFFETNLNIARFGNAKMFAQINDDVTESGWSMSPHEVNAYYTPLNNEIVFPAAILQHPFFSPHAPKFLNYAAIGTVIGHEITHGFDDSGRRFDAKGLMRDWWTSQSSQNFEKKAKCFVDHYSKYGIRHPETGKVFRIDGELTLGENLADNGGMKMAYSAWKASQKNANATVPATLKVGAGKRLTKDQLFFVGFAQMWCSEMAPDYAVKLIHQDPHALPKVRVLGSVSNSREFADAFKCPINAPMNPTKKCQLW